MSKEFQRQTLSGVLVLLSGLMISGCVPKVASLEGKSCSANGLCADGFHCDLGSSVCLADDASDAGSQDTGGQDAGPDAGPDGGVNDGGDGGSCGTEVCNGQDDDCDGLTDEGLTDQDHDGFCADPTVDCDDKSDLINPDQKEVCDGLDNDCDGLTDVAMTDPLLGVPCTDDSVKGECQAGETICQGGSRVCQGSASAQHDFCGRDSNCDGSFTLPASLDLSPLASLAFDPGSLAQITPDHFRISPPSDVPTLNAGLVYDTSYLHPADAEAATHWTLITGNHGSIVGTTLTIGAKGSGADVELRPGLHQFRLSFEDPCGTGTLEKIFEVQVGSPDFGTTPGGELDIKAVCIDPSNQTLWVGSKTKGYALDPSTASLDTLDATAAGLFQIAGCAVDASNRGCFAGKGAGDPITCYSNPSDLSVSTNYGVAGSNAVSPRGIVADGSGRPWLVSEGKLKYFDPNAATSGRYVENASWSSPPGGGQVRAITPGAAGMLWVATDKGVNRLEVGNFVPGSTNPAWSFSGNSLELFVAASAGSVTAHADSIAYDRGVLWALTRGADNTLVRFSAQRRLEDPTGRPLDQFVRRVTLPGTEAALPASKGNGLVVWPDHDLMIASDQGLLRYQPCEGVPGCVPMLHSIRSGEKVRDLVIPESAFGGPAPWPLYLATDKGLRRYEGE